MKQAQLCFKLELDYQTKLFKPLSELAVYHTYSKEDKVYNWVFPINKIKNVLAVLGHPFKFSEDDISLAKTYSDDKKQQIKKGAVYGEGFVSVKLHPSKPNYFLVTTVRERQPENTTVSIDTVNALWRVIKKQPKEKKILTATVAKNYCKELGITDFDVYEHGEFNWKYFSGSRKYYLVFYAAIKVLQHYGVVEHIVQASQSGVARKTDLWSIQTELDLEE